MHGWTQQDVEYPQQQRRRRQRQRQKQQQQQQQLSSQETKGAF